MPGRRLLIQRDANHVFIFAPRQQLTGRQVAQVTDRCRAALDGFRDYRFHPAHDADVFAWVIEFASLRAAGRFFHLIPRSIRDRTAQRTPTIGGVDGADGACLPAVVLCRTSDDSPIAAIDTLNGIAHIVRGPTTPPNMADAATILFVVRNEPLLLSWARALHRAGCAVLVARDAAINVLVNDLELRNPSGPEFVDRGCERVPVLYLTEHRSDGTRRMAI